MHAPHKLDPLPLLPFRTHMYSIKISFRISNYLEPQDLVKFHHIYTCYCFGVGRDEISHIYVYSMYMSWRVHVQMYIQAVLATVYIARSHGATPTSGHLIWSAYRALE